MMDHYLLIQDAAKVAHLSTEDLFDMISAGKIKPAMLSTTGALLVKREDLPVRREDTPEWAQVALLQGVGIGVRQAAEKYNLQPKTISGWVDRGLIHRLSGEVLRGQRVLIDEAEVAYYALIYKRDPGQGKRTLQKR